MNRLLIAIFIFLLSGSPIHAQDYFQQEVNYDIEVSLNDENHTLSGYIDMEYINNSPDALKEIYIHLWPNAYRNRKTAFAKQQVQMGSSRFYFATNDQLGGLKDLDFLVNDESVEWDFWKDNRDIALLKLKTVLPSGGKIIISTPFALKIPSSFSRLGHVGQSYQISQWYPKPAVYDQNGWHPMPYLDMGEFYSEFGSFDVKLTLPKNYVVGATGVLQNKSELDFLEAKAKEAAQILKVSSLPNVKDFPESSSDKKTIQYKAENVHDFAWFADKRFHVTKSQIELASGKTIDTWAMFSEASELWKDATKYLDRSVKFYSDHVGEYPWPQATAVQSALSAGAGMEYPMITVIGRGGSPAALDEVITHEVGHNWFYGILASNERDFAWMDEGINSFYEKRYMATYYKGDRNMLGRVGLPGSFAKGLSNGDMAMLPHIAQEKRGKYQPICSHSSHFTTINYGLGVYDKTSILFNYLESYLGKTELDRIMGLYFKQWKFKHPQPADLKKLFEAESGKNMDWFFNDMICSTKVYDYKVLGLDGDKLSVQNTGEIKAPFPVSGMKDGKVVETIWHEAIEGTASVDLPKGDFDEYRINAHPLYPETNIKDNNVSVSGSTADGFSIGVLPRINNPRKNNLYLTPTIGYNAYDGFMAGISAYSGFLPSSDLEFSISPLYGTSSSDIVGEASLAYHIFPTSKSIQEVIVGLSGRKFNYFENDFYEPFEEAFFGYYRISPFVTIKLAPEKANSTKSQEINFRSSYMKTSVPGQIGRDTLISGLDTTITVNYAGHKQLPALVNALSYTYKDRDVLQPFSFTLGVEHQAYTDVFDEKQNYLKATLEAKYAYAYKSGKYINLRFFGGGFLSNSRKDKSVRNSRGALGLISQGGQDYTYSDYYFGRGESEGIWSQQISLTDGAFKAPGLAQSGGFGLSNEFLVAANIKIDLPMKFPAWMPKIRPYCDVGYFSNAQPTGADDGFEDQFLVSGGLALEYGDGVFGIYIPAFGSKNVTDKLKGRGDLSTRISFNFDLGKLNPNKIIRNFNVMR